MVRRAPSTSVPTGLLSAARAVTLLSSRLLPQFLLLWALIPVSLVSKNITDLDISFILVETHLQYVHQKKLQMYVLYDNGIALSKKIMSYSS